MKRTANKQKMLFRKTVIIGELYKYIAFIAFVMLPLVANAAPSITSFSGTVSHGQPITISGSSFTVKPYAAPELWDTVDNISAYSALSNGATIPVGVGKPWMSNGYYSYTLNNMKLSTGTQRGVSTKNYGATAEASFEYHPIAHPSGAIYLSWWIRSQGSLPNSLKFLRISDSRDEQYKTFSMAVDNQYVFLRPSTASCYNNSYTGSIGANKPPADTWTRFEVLLDGNNKFYTTWMNGVQKGTYSWASGGCDAVSFNSLWRIGIDEESATFWMDDVYLDTTPARVEICSGSTWATRGHCEVQPATSWDVSTVVVSVNQGSFVNGTSAYIYLIDNNGIASNGRQILFGSSGGGTSDTTLPTASITNPVAGATVSGNVSVSVSASDNVGVTKVELYVDGTLSNSDTTSPYTFTWNTATASNGSHTLSTKAYDALNNAGTSTSVTVTVSNTFVDTTAPTVSISSPTNGAEVTGNIGVTTSVSDNVGISKVEFFMDSATTPAATITSSPYTFTLNTALVANGTHTVNAKAYDAANNIGQSTTVSVTVNNSTTPAGSIMRNECANPPVGTVFCEDFEGINPKSHFDDYDGNPDTENLVVTDNGPSADPANKEVRLRVPTGQGGGSDLIKVLPGSYDKLYARWYFKYEPGFNFNAGNHGGGLAAGDRNLIGQSGIRPTGDDWAGFFMQYNPGTPYNVAPYAYSYYRGMYQDCSDPNGGCYGDSLPCVFDSGASYCTKPQDRPAVTLPTLVAGKWYCYEQLVDMGTASTNGTGATGRLTQWMDGSIISDNSNLWLRTTSSLKLQNLWLSLYFGDGTHSTVGELIDNVVVSTQRVGCGSIVPLPIPANLKTISINPD